MGKGKKEEESTAILWMPFREMQGGGPWRFFWNALSVRGQTRLVPAWMETMRALQAAQNYGCFRGVYGIHSGMGPGGGSE